MEISIVVAVGVILAVSLLARVGLGERHRAFQADVRRRRSRRQGHAAKSIRSILAN